MSEAKAIRDRLCIESECTFDRGCGCLEAIEAALAARDAEIERLKQGWETAFNIGVSEQEQNKKLRAEIERLRAENFALAADQCHSGYAGEHGHHMCGEIERLRTALQPFAAMANTTIRVMNDGDMVLMVPLKHMDAAVAALGAHKPDMETKP